MCRHPKHRAEVRHKAVVACSQFLEQWRELVRMRSLVFQIAGGLRS